MKFNLSQDEIKLLKKANIDFMPDYEYDVDVVFDLLDSIYAKEVYYAQENSKSSKGLANAYADLADKIQKSIPR